MAYVCRSCDYFDGEGAHASDCPTCGGVMRFTLLEPRGAVTATLEPTSASTASLKPAKAQWHDPYVYGYEEVEAPWAVRYAQIGVGVTTYFLISRLGVPIILLPLAFAMSDAQPRTIMLVLGLAALALYSLAAIAGGFIAGIWTRYWVPQGLGVAAGVSFIPLIMLLVFAPESLGVYLITVAITSALTVVGAYLGHVIVKPTRIPKS
jgi:MFS family permease